MNESIYQQRGLGVRQIAVYGKGGIGKSTISANVSAALALAGACVLQVGCDPKQDSTRLLLEGRRVTTVLDYLRSTEPGDRTLASVVHPGFSGVACVEAGGPEPGVGCAGRGILSALDLLESLGVSENRYDVVLYDVLGDVVCGGFAVPLRERYADFIYIVTSGEFMSLYAANNILRGVRNFEERGLRMAGIILNGRGLPGEDDRVRRFADAVYLPVVASIPRSQGSAQQNNSDRAWFRLFRTIRCSPVRRAGRTCAQFPIPIPCPSMTLNRLYSTERPIALTLRRCLDR
jgi:nitrogenase iron protein